MKIGPVSLLVVLVSMLLFGFWSGVNVGIAQSMTIGPIEACKNIRWPILICE